MDLTALLGTEPVVDAEEEAFVVFSQDIPSQSLGFIDSQAATLDISVAGYDLTIHQSRGLLTSNRKEGTTGAVVWKLTPLLATWLTSHTNPFTTSPLLPPGSTILELGAGISGILALTLASKVSHYIATDQSYVMKLLRQNILENLPTVLSKHTTGKKAQKPTSRTKKKPTHQHQQQQSHSNPVNNAEEEGDRIKCEILDWETSDPSPFPPLDMIIAADCIYNESLIEPLNTTCAALCKLRSSSSSSPSSFPSSTSQSSPSTRSSSDDDHARPTICLIAQQLRSPDVFEAWIKSFHRLFEVWRVPDGVLSGELSEGGGFVVHVGIVR